MFAFHHLVAPLMFVLLGAVLQAQEISVQRGETAEIPASFESAFSIEFDGEFRPETIPRFTARRYLYDGGENQSIDLFEKGRFRLGNTKLFFLSASKGRIRNPGGQKDHYAEVGSFQGLHRVRISYDPGEKRCRIWIDDSLEGDFDLEIRKAGRVGRLSFVGFSGKIRVLQGTGGPGSLDEVVKPGRVAADGAEATPLTANNSGTRTVTAAVDGSLRVKAKLSTYGGAVLSVTLVRDGAVRRWLHWRRQNESDSSPLLVDGKARIDSMFERDPGDFSPREVEAVTEVRRGDVMTFSLEGNFGGGTPLLSYTVPAAAK